MIKQLILFILLIGSASVVAQQQHGIRPAVEDLDFKIAQMVMVGIGDRTSLVDTDPLVAELKSNKFGGIVLYEKNIAKENSKETLKKMIKDFQSHAAIPLFVSIDEEGGKVHRLKEKYGFVKMPSVAYLGAMANTDSTYFYTQHLAALLKELGININYAPDVDLASNPSNPVIAKIERSYSVNPQVVTQHALANIKAHHKHGVKTIIKHFPGHGSSSTDSHLGIADVSKTWDAKELIPYKEIIRSGQCDAIMTAHIVNCQLDTSCVPGTLSKPIVSDLLRTQLGYKGVVFSDDMQMNAISSYFGIKVAVKLAIQAGVDVIMFAGNVNPQEKKISATEVFDMIKSLVQEGEISEQRIQESYDRILKLKDKTF